MLVPCAMHSALGFLAVCVSEKKKGSLGYSQGSSVFGFDFDLEHDAASFQPIFGQKITRAATSVMIPGVISPALKLISLPGDEHRRKPN